MGSVHRDAVERRLALVEKPAIAGIEPGLRKRSNRLDRAPEVGEVGRGRRAELRSRPNPHPGLGDDAEDPFGAQHPSVGARPSTGAGQASRLPGSPGRDRSDRLREVVDVRVDGSEVTTGASCEPTTERRELERLREVTKREAVLRELRLQHRTGCAGLNTRGERAPLHLDDAIEAPEVKAEHSLVAIIDIRFDATHHAGASAERNYGNLRSARPVENVVDLRFVRWTRNEIRSGGEVTPEATHHVAVVAAVGMPDARFVIGADRMREASRRAQTRAAQLDRFQCGRLIEPLRREAEHELSVLGDRFARICVRELVLPAPAPETTLPCVAHGPRPSTIAPSVCKRLDGPPDRGFHP